MRRIYWVKFFLYLIRLFILLFLLAVVMPKLIEIGGAWGSLLWHHEQVPHGNSLRVDARPSVIESEYLIDDKRGEGTQ